MKSTRNKDIRTHCHFREAHIFNPIMFRNKSSPNSNSSRSAVPKPPKTDKDPYKVPGFENYGKHCFAGKVADNYLKKYGSTHSILKDPNWVKEDPDLVAAAVLDW